MFSEAKNMAAHREFANPFDTVVTGLTAISPPLYPLVLALLMKLLVAPSLIVRAAVLGNIVANALTAALLPRMSVVFYGDSLPGAWAAALWLAAAQLMPVWDVGYTAAGLILFCLFGARFIGRPDKAVRFGAWTGAAAGMLFLLNPASLLIDLPWIAYLIGRRNLPWAQAARYSGALLAILLLIISSWALRNRHQMGALVVRTNLGMTLYASNNDCAQASLAEDMREGCYQTHHPNTSTSEAILFRTLGEVEYDRRRTVDAENWALGHPRRFGCLTAERFRYFWFPPLGEHEFRTGAIWLATALSIPGIFLMLKHRLPVVVFVATVQLIYPLMYYVVVSDVRYRYPVLWLSLLPAGYFIASLHTARYGADRCPPPQARPFVRGNNSGDRMHLPSPVHAPRLPWNDPFRASAEVCGGACRRRCAPAVLIYMPKGKRCRRTTADGCLTILGARPAGEWKLRKKSGRERKKAKES